jgi:hypothetical protein
MMLHICCTNRYAVCYFTALHSRRVVYRNLFQLLFILLLMFVANFIEYLFIIYLLRITFSVSCLTDCEWDALSVAH